MNRTFFIAGVQFRPHGDISIAGAKMNAGDLLQLIPEPTNKFDPNAVKIIFSQSTTEGLITVFLGYVPKKYSSEVAGMVSIGTPVECIVEAVDPLAKTYEMFKVTVKIPVEEENGAPGLNEDEFEGDSL